MDNDPVPFKQYIAESENNPEKYHTLRCLARALIEYGKIEDESKSFFVSKAHKYSHYISLCENIPPLNLEICHPSIVCHGLYSISELNAIASEVCSFFRDMLNSHSDFKCKCADITITPSSRITLTGVRKQFAVDFVRRFNNLYFIVNRLEQIRSDFGAGTAYSCSVAVIQSSGNGKTRTFIEIGKRIPIIYVCHREFDETSSFPPHTPLIIDHLKFFNSTVNVFKNDIAVANRCAAFICTSAIVTRSAWLLSKGKLGDNTWEKFINLQFENSFWIDFIQLMDRIETMINF